ncbi:hypothetical protein B7764_23850 (plasmid) [Pantoea ananatis]|uniref:phosphotransferase n=1 Tax=Pantoea ananas TaxID=553 RepID=UPI000B604084|nr:phosphotransferase [Pantoea ananatis]ASN18176.1 hypothetical protein B7764_23850 [Pantoea ananatis]
MIEFLLLEDELAESNFIKEILYPHSITHVRDLEEMQNLCKDDKLFFDYAVLDLSVPESSKELEPKEKNGMEAFRLFRRIFPGTPILILTGSTTNDYVTEIIQQTSLAKIWGSNEINTIDFLKKNRLDELGSKIDKIVIEINNVKDINLYTSHSTYNLLHEETKIKRLFSIIANKLNGFFVEITPVSPGYSGAKIHLLDVKDENNNTFSKIIVKSGSFDKIQEESKNYDDYVLTRLDHSKFPPKVDMTRFGAKDITSIYYKFLDNSTHMSLFNYMSSTFFDVDKIKLCFNLTKEWRDTSKTELKTIGEIRRSFLSDENLDKLRAKFNLSWVTAFEQRRVNFKLCYNHCDFHGGNVFINPNSSVFHVIDYGDIKMSPIAIDAICLELGFFYNKDSTISNWFVNAPTGSWADDDAFFAGSDIAKLKVIRDWAKENASLKEFLAAAYCYTIRQLKFPDVQQNKLKETLAILDSINIEFSKS